jgi:hypothetical protein
MSLKLKTKKVSFWVLVNENLHCEKVDEDYTLGDEECMFLINLLDPKESYSLIDTAIEHEWERNQRFDKPNWLKLKTQKIKKMFVDWKGVVNEETGEVIPCTDPMKQILFLNNSTVFDAVVDFAEELQKKQQKIKEDDLKNLEDGQTGSSVEAESPTVTTAGESTN